jgi:DNA-binding CsgD family transcriptional regulator
VLELLERDDEAAQIEAAIEDCAHGRGRLVVIRGAAGIGKTQLVERTVDAAGEAGVRTLTARAGELERDFPFGCAVALFAPVIAAEPTPARDQLLAGAAALCRQLIDPAAAPGPPHADPAFALLHGFYWLTANLCARGPVLIAVDDAHWADEATLRLLSFLARRAAELPLALVVAARDAEPGAPDSLVDLLAAEPLAAELRPAPLSRAAVGRLARARLGWTCSEDFCDACHDATGGNPFLLEQLVAAIWQDGIVCDDAGARCVASLAPDAVARAALTRIGRLGPDAIAVAEAAAVLRDDAAPAEFAALTGLGRDDVAAAIDELAAIGVFAPRGLTGFVHPIVRAAVEADLPPGRRELLHAAAARALHDARADPHRIASHLLASAPARRPWAVAVLLEAAHRAEGRGGAAAARAYLERALAEPPPPSLRGSVLRGLGVALHRLGRPEAVGHLEEALALAEGDRTALVATGRALARALLDAGRVDTATGILDALADLDPDGTSDEHWAIEAELAGTMLLDGRLWREGERRALALPRSLPGQAPGGRLALVIEAYALMRTGAPSADVLALVDGAVPEGELPTEIARDLVTLSLLVTVLFACDRLDQALAVCDRARADAGLQGAAPIATLMSWYRSRIQHARGHMAEAIADVEPGELDAELPWITPIADAQRAIALVERDDLRAAQASVGDDEEIARFDGQLAQECLLRARATVRMAAGDAAGAARDFLGVWEVLDRFGICNPAGVHARSSAALAFAASGDGDRARELAAAELTAARAFGAPTAVGRSLRALGVVTDDLDALREAVAMLAASPARTEHARALLDLGAALRRADRQREAAERLREALDLAGRCGARALERQARDELAVLGLRPRRTAVAGVDALTAAELRVARLAATGRTNRAIAQELFVSVKTVETHLRRCFDKLGVGARQELADALTRPAPSD